MYKLNLGLLTDIADTAVRVDDIGARGVNDSVGADGYTVACRRELRSFYCVGYRLCAVELDVYSTEDIGCCGCVRRGKIECCKCGIVRHC